jgi:hypothetical protein
VGLSPPPAGTLIGQTGAGGGKDRIAILRG